MLDSGDLRRSLSGSSRFLSCNRRCRFDFNLGHCTIFITLLLISFWAFFPVSRLLFNLLLVFLLRQFLRLTLSHFSSNSIERNRFLDLLNWGVLLLFLLWWYFGRRLLRHAKLWCFRLETCNLLIAMMAAHGRHIYDLLLALHWHQMMRHRGLQGLRVLHLISISFLFLCLQNAGPFVFQGLRKVTRRHLGARMLGELLTVLALLYFNHRHGRASLSTINGVSVRGVMVYDQVVKLHLCHFYIMVV